MKKQKSKVEVNRLEIKRVDFEIEVPSFTVRQLKSIQSQSMSNMDARDQYNFCHGVNIHEKNDPFKVCFRSPSDFGLESKIFHRVWDFNKALWGETLESKKVIALCCALNQVSKDSPLYLGCGSSFHVMSAPEDVGGSIYFNLQISRDSKKNPTITVEQQTSPIWFNPTSHYGVLV